MSVTAIHLHIHGRVQNVGFRRWTQNTAKELGLTGWVRNRVDGTVEAVLCGEAASVARMHQECERGPIGAHVIRVDVNLWSGETPVGFEQLETPRDGDESTIRIA